MINRDQLLNNEEGTVYKAFSKYRVALIYPNSYHLGMSNLGFHTIYNELNNRKDTFCERIFFENQKSFFSLETKRSIHEFDILAFSISYELDYFNVLRILKRARIPIKKTDRSNNYPILVAGGAVTGFNFKPLRKIVDIVITGEAENIIHTFMGEYAGFHIDRTPKSKESFLSKLSNTKSFFVSGKQDKVIPARISNLNNFQTHSRILSNFTEFPDTFLIEISRGCPFKCFFCATSHSNNKVRFRDYKNVLDTVKKGLKFTNRIGLIGSSLPNYPNIDLLCESLISLKAKVSFSSLRVDFISDMMIKMLVDSGQRSITIAPESGSEQLRGRINKPISDNRIIETVERARNFGIKIVKLYFMVGLPGETQADVSAIIELSKRISKILKVKFSITPFVSKPTTPFSKKPFEGVSSLKRKIEYLKLNLRKIGPASFESPRFAYLEYLLSNGDEDILFSLLEKKSKPKGLPSIDTT